MLGEDFAVADVKYKLSGSDWNRPDLYQFVTFATGFRAWHAALINFRMPGTDPLPRLSVGDVRVAHLAWSADQARPPQAVAEEFAQRATLWLDSFASLLSLGA